MNDMMQEISQFPNGTYLRMTWAHEGLILGGTIDTIYETDNGRIEGTPSYREYYACAFRIKRVFENPNNSVYPEGSLIEISPDTAPTMIALEDGSLVWRM